jgi:hypothetical protein
MCHLTLGQKKPEQQGQKTEFKEKKTISRANKNWRPKLQLIQSNTNLIRNDLLKLFIVTYQNM